MPGMRNARCRDGAKRIPVMIAMGSISDVPLRRHRRPVPQGSATHERPHEVIRAYRTGAGRVEVGAGPRRRHSAPWRIPRVVPRIAESAVDSTLASGRVTRTLVVTHRHRVGPERARGAEPLSRSRSAELGHGYETTRSDRAELAKETSGELLRSSRVGLPRSVHGRAAVREEDRATNSSAAIERHDRPKRMPDIGKRAVRVGVGARPARVRGRRGVA